MDYNFERGKNRDGRIVELTLTEDERILITQKVIENLKAGRDMSDPLDDYSAVLDIINEERIELRERLRQHDIKARTEEFNFLAGAYRTIKQFAFESIAESIAESSKPKPVRLFYS
ncbi:MAG: hypothetical protein AABX84_03225 [Nanoarchaeota archaeon]